MHCAKLFEICQEPEANVFAKFKEEDYIAARRVCINAILHTDMVNHFEMVKNINMVYELCSTICDKQATRVDAILNAYVDDVLCPNMHLLTSCFLHLADISNPLKPFKICKAWAMKVLDEFFAQGDEEKRIGIPVGMLNDRDKVNRIGPQHGFINFIVSPLAIATVRVFQPLSILVNEMVVNLNEWMDMWIEVAEPPQEDIDKRTAEVQQIVNLIDPLLARGGFVTSGQKMSLTTVTGVVARSATKVALSNKPLCDKSLYRHSTSCLSDKPLFDNAATGYSCRTQATSTSPSGRPTGVTSESLNSHADRGVKSEQESEQESEPELEILF